MPKMKTNSAAAKRFLVKKSGKVKHKKANLRHNLTLGKSPKGKRHMTGPAYVNQSDVHKVYAVMPYSR